MPTYSYFAKDQTGKPLQGRADAETQAAAVSALRARGWLVLDVRPYESASLSGRRLLAAIRPTSWLPPRRIDVELSLQQLGVMLRSGLTLLSALGILQAQSRRASMSRVWRDVADRIQEGSSLADAMAHHRCFPPMVLQLVRVGEQTGSLEEVVDRAASSLESQRMIRSNLITAMIYPFIVLVMAIGVTALMVLYLIPKLKTSLDALSGKLPAMTMALIQVSDFAQQYALTGLILVIVLLCFFAILRAWPPGRLFIDRTLLRIPMVGEVIRLAGTAWFARSLSVMLRSGVSLLECLRTTEGLMGNAHMARCVSNAREQVMAGGGLSEPLAQPGAFTPMLPQMVHVGESSGTLDEVLEEVADFHESQLQVAIRRFSGIFEPALIIIVGGIVGFVYISFFVGMFSIYGAR